MVTFQTLPQTAEQSFAQPFPTNKRASVRYKCGLATPGRVHLDGQEWQRAWVVDLSRHGVGLLLSRPLLQGLAVAVHLKSNGEKKVLEMSARVCHSTQQHDGDWIVGFEFDADLTDDTLDALLQ